MGSTPEARRRCLPTK